MEPARFLAAFPSRYATNALLTLADHGVFVSQQAAVSGKVPGRQLAFHTALVAAHPALQGKITAILQKVRFMRLFKSSSSARHRMRLLSASGQGNGACYADVPYLVSMLMPDVDFRLSAY